MGADIHVYVEKYNKENNEWEYIFVKNAQDQKVDWYYRNYVLFGMLAEVRAMGIPGYTEVRGLPHDVSTDVLEKYKEWEEDFHSVTWYSKDELYKMLQYIKKEKEIKELKYENMKLKNEDEEKLEYMKIIIEESEEEYAILQCFNDYIDFICEANWAYGDIRVIVWFDS